jgi:hypothetical protein
MKLFFDAPQPTIPHYENNHGDSEKSVQNSRCMRRRIRLASARHQSGDKLVTAIQGQVKAAIRSMRGCLFADERPE